MRLTLRAPSASKFVPDEFVFAQNKRTKQKGAHVLACGFTVLLGLSGDWSKLANAQTLTNPYPDKPVLLVSTTGEGELKHVLESNPGSPFAKPSIAEIFGLARRLFERSEFRRARIYREAQGTRRASKGMAFFWFVFWPRKK